MDGLTSLMQSSSGTVELTFATAVGDGGTMVGDGGMMVGVGRLAALEAPGAAQYAGGDVEQALALAVAARGVVEKRCGLVVDLDAATARRDAVDRGQEARALVARVARF